MHHWPSTVTLCHTLNEIGHKRTSNLCLWSLHLSGTCWATLSVWRHNLYIISVSVIRSWSWTILFYPDPMVFDMSAARRETVSSKLTSVSIESSKGVPLLWWAGAVCDLHLQLVPGRLLQVVQDVALGQWCALGRGPGGRVHRSVLQYEGGDRAAAVVPADQVEPGPGGVDAGEEFVFFGKLGFWGRGQREKLETQEHDTDMIM